MSSIRHGLSIGLERYQNTFFLTLKATGKLTHKDYQEITPMIDAALKGVSNPQVRAFVDMSEFDGWEARAAWDDFRLGLKHGSAFEKIALYGDNKWQSNMAHIANWFIAGEVEFFTDAAAAFHWLEH